MKPVELKTTVQASDAQILKLARLQNVMLAIAVVFVGGGEDGLAVFHHI